MDRSNEEILMKSVLYLLSKIQDKDSREKYLRLYNSILDDFTTAPAAVKYHHNWMGGLYVHTEQVMNIAVDMFNDWKDNLNIKLDDIIIVSFIHDLDKMYRYELRPESERKKNKVFYLFKTRKDKHNYSNEMEVLRILAGYNISLTKEQTEALAWHEGGWSDASFLKHKSNSQLPVIIHIADLFSAKILKKQRNVE